MNFKTCRVLISALPGLGFAAAANANPLPFGSPLYIPPVLSAPNITLTAAQTSEQIFDGMPTTMWTYNGTPRSRARTGGSR